MKLTLGVVGGAVGTEIFLWSIFVLVLHKENAKKKIISMDLGTSKHHLPWRCSYGDIVYFIQIEIQTARFVLIIVWLIKVKIMKIMNHLQQCTCMYMVLIVLLSKYNH